ncbi:hypothetical protein SAMN04489761_0019 [Tenacibaculum sp. MAR_2009_124]|uniref:DUF6438 domain-containing protein n=1 Tax=Tenacibaculum sp. MAR_2009_124 TaxID=1250059 RepID=UPI000898A508|nr:DUF6438 domain-containing protein [Tenacibaculum sp. MAR_2009_124]SEB35079.1 hypothetical protein SAMN04489761_0019 [Tenacibaculum sp. MAR_2009_124]
MKYILFFTLLLVLSCDSPKKEKKKEIPAPVEEVIKATEEEDIKVEKTVVPVKDYSKELVVVLKYAQNSDEALSLLKNSSLQWKDSNYDSKVTKIGVVTLPDTDRQTWIQRLKESGAFKLVSKNEEGAIDNAIIEEEKILITLSKTACFGDCPVYEVTIDKNGNLVFNGIQYVKEEGIQTFKLSENELKTLKNKLDKKDFNNFKNVYDDPEIMDLASTYITYNNKQVKIRLWKDLPDELIEVHEYIGDLLYKRKFLE